MRTAIEREKISSVYNLLIFLGIKEPGNHIRMQISVEAYSKLRLHFLLAGFPNLTGKVICKCKISGARN